MNRKLYYFRQLVDSPALNDAWDGAELADQRIVLDTSIGSILSGAVVAQAGSPNLTVQVSAGTSYDQLGQRASVPSTQTVDMSVDHLSVLTEVTGPGNEKWLSVFLVFERAESDPFVDGNSVPGFFTQDESYSLQVYQGAEAPAGTANRPGLISPGLLLADVLIDDTTTQILNAAISITRRQDSIVIAGTANSVRRGLIRDALSDIAGFLDDHITGVGNNHPASGIDYAGGGTWADGTTNPAATVEAQLDKFISDLATTASSGGTARVGAGALVGASSTIVAGTLFAALTALKSAANIDLAARTTWLGGRTNGAATLYAGIDKIITDLAATTSSDDGCERIGAQASGGLSSGSARSQLDALDARGFIVGTYSWSFDDEAPAFTFESFTTTSYASPGSDGFVDVPNTLVGDELIVTTAWTVDNSVTPTGNGNRLRILIQEDFTGTPVDTPLSGARTYVMGTDLRSVSLVGRFVSTTAGTTRVVVQGRVDVADALRIQSAGSIVVVHRRPTP